MRTPNTTAPMTSPHHTPRRVTARAPDSGTGVPAGCGDDGVMSVRLPNREVQRQSVEHRSVRRIQSRRLQHRDLSLAVYKSLRGDWKALGAAGIEPEIDANRTDGRLVPDAGTGRDRPDTAREIDDVLETRKRAGSDDTAVDEEREPQLTAERNREPVFHTRLGERRSPERLRIELAVLEPCDGVHVAACIGDVGR